MAVIDRKAELAKAQARIERIHPGLLSRDFANKRQSELFHGVADFGDALIDFGDALIGITRRIFKGQ